MRRLYGYMLRYRWRYVFGFVCLLVTASVAMVIPYFLKRAVEVIEHDRELRGLRFYVLLIIGLAIVQGVARTFSRFVIFNIGRDIEYDLRNDLFAHLQTLSASFYQRSQTGDLMSRLVNDIGAVRMMIGPGILNFVNTPVYYLYAVAIMVTISVPLTLLSLTAYPLVLWIVKRLSRTLMERTVKVQEGLAALSARAQENLSGMAVIKAYALENSEVESFRRMNAEFQELGLALARVRGFIAPVMKIVSSVGILVVLWFGGWLVDTRSDRHRRSRRLHRLPSFARLADDGARLDALDLAARARLDDATRAHLQRGARDRRSQRRRRPTAPIERGRDRVRRRVLRLSRAQEPAGVSTTCGSKVPAGATVAIVGRTGAGKTTLVSLLPRLFDAVRGSRTDRRPRRPFAVARHAAPCDGRRSAGPVSVLHDHSREHRLRPRRQRRRRRPGALGGAGRRPREGSRGAAARPRDDGRGARHHAFRADRSSASPWPARSPSIRRC